MKNILMAVQPKWLAKILNGEKDVEIRKTIPECLKNGEPITVWFYCTKEISFEHRLWRSPEHYTNKCYIEAFSHNMFDKKLNGLVAAKCVVEKYDTISYDFMNDVVGGEVLETGKPAYYITNGQIESARITYYELLKYGKTKPLYALHLTALTVFDKPMELKDFTHWNIKKWHNETHWIPLTRAPQSWMRVEVGE